MRYEKIYLSWERYKKHIKRIIKKIKKSKFLPEVIVAIARGGTIPGVQLSHFFGINFFILYYRHTKSDKPFDYREDVKLEGKILGDMRNKKILIVDDIAGDGKTIEKAIKEVKLKKPKEIKVATLVIDEETLKRTKRINLIDFYSMKIDSKKWVVFPWEKIE
jgi:hypothetical protein